MKGTKKYGNKIFIITENQTNALREEINMADSLLSKEIFP